MFRTVIAALLLLSATAHADVVFGFVANRGIEQGLEDWQPIADDMSQRLGQKVRLLAVRDDKELSERFARNEIQIARSSTQTALNLVEHGNGQVFARLVLTGGKGEYRSLLLTRKGGPATLEAALSQPKRLNFASGFNGNTATYLIPQYLAFAKGNVLADQYFKSISYGNSLDNFRALVDGKADLAASSSDEYEKLQERFPKDAAKLQVIWQSPAFSYDPLVIRRDVPATTQGKIRDFFVQYGRTGAAASNEMTKLYYADQLAGFLPSTNRQLREVTDLQLFYALFRLTLNNQLAQDARKEQEKALYRRYDQLVSILGGAY
ncbi:PhnD/SsuA/transferrin family substrate-binding protein [Chitinilyticum piscinae]|uniref:PhnD/SsuA/transferrin family substrate-binding protein n=1 Tax=Chitinilyticum piscinae TaxID=2866724 RepID=A0A8J7K2T1_9NEIS|nr:PhnD/SsuA/transferrin family substrate-binding protein [Chitinilyticum piscinae]MBE9610447.1 PhnD/SsuA/transferrin family substrate-binding protein [Chitinilyticum piscinae]